MWEIKKTITRYKTAVNGFLTYYVGCGLFALMFKWCECKSMVMKSVNQGVMYMFMTKMTSLRFIYLNFYYTLIEEGGRPLFYL